MLIITEIHVYTEIPTEQARGNIGMNHQMLAIIRWYSCKLYAVKSMYEVCLKKVDYDYMTLLWLQLSFSFFFF